MHLDEAAEHRARGGSRAPAREHAELARREREIERRGGGLDERGEPRGRRRETRAGREVVRAHDARAPGHARALAEQVEARGDLRELIGAALPVEHELVGGEPRVELDVRVGPERVERDRDRAYGRHVEPRVRLAPVLYEREVRARPRARVPRAGRLRGSHGP